ncbi:MAG: hypothetical protein Q7U04_16230 [Bacteriovorax sp.]|nr:hypothetical protein [Bacteriovorax sp.]
MKNSPILNWPVKSASYKQLALLKKLNIYDGPNITSKLASCNIAAKLDMKKAKITHAFLDHSIIPASLKLKRIITNKGITVANDISRMNAVDILSELGFSVDTNDVVTQD